MCSFVQLDSGHPYCNGDFRNSLYCRAIDVRRVSLSACVGGPLLWWRELPAQGEPTSSIIITSRYHRSEFAELERPQQILITMTKHLPSVQQGMLLRAIQHSC